MPRSTRTSAVGGMPPLVCARCHKGDGGFATRGGRRYSRICTRCKNAKANAAAAERKRKREHRKSYNVWQMIRRGGE